MGPKNKIMIKELANASKVMIDTAPLVYFIEEHEKYLDILSDTFSKIDSGEKTGITSIVTLIEVLVKPLKDNNQKLVNEYQSILTASRNILLVDITQNIGKKAAELRAKYNILLPDAIQIAVGIMNDADIFLTNDELLKKVTEINVVVLEEIIGIHN